MAQSPVALVTGGAQGLGAAIVEALLSNGYKVSVADLQKEKGEEFVKSQQEIHGSDKVAFVQCDVTKEEEYRNAFEFTREKFSKIDVVANNAGIVNEHNPRKTVEVNLIGPIIGCQLAIEYLGKSRGGKGGIVLNTASIVGLLPFHGIPVYSATKHGVVGLTRSYGMPYHLEREGIIFTALCPFFVETAIIDSVKEKSLLPGFDPRESYDFMTPEYVAKAALKLLEDRINGSVLIVTKHRGYEYVGYQEIFKDFRI